MDQIQVSRRKGRVAGATLGLVLLGPIGLAAGALLGTRTETQIEDRKSRQEQIEEYCQLRDARQKERQRRRDELIAKGRDPDLVSKMLFAAFAIMFGLPLLLELIVRVAQALGQAGW